MMKMVGFNEIYQSKCFNKENYNKNNIRLAVLAKKTKLILKEYIEMNTNMVKPQILNLIDVINF